MIVLSNLKIKTIYNLLDLYLLSVALLTLDVLLSASVPLRVIYLPLHPLTMIIIYIIICLQLYAGRYNRTKTVIGCILIFLGILNYVQFHRNWLLYLAFILLFIEGRDIKKVIKVIYKCLIVVISINFIGFFICYLAFPDMVNVKYSKDIIRYDMFCGDHPNTAVRLWIFVVISWFSLYYEMLSWKKWIILLSLTSYVYYFTRSEALLLILVIFIFWLFRKSKIIICTLRFFARYGVGLMLIFSLASLWMKSNPYLYKLYEFINLASTGRLFYTETALRVNNISIFGKEYVPGMQTAYGNVIYYVDNAYIFILLYYGAIYFIILAIMIYLAVPKMNYIGLICLTIYLLYGLIENGIFDVVSVVPLIFVVDALYKHKINGFSH